MHLSKFKVLARIGQDHFIRKIYLKTWAAEEWNIHGGERFNELIIEASSIIEEHGWIVVDQSSPSSSSSDVVVVVVE